MGGKIMKKTFYFLFFLILFIFGCSQNNNENDIITFNIEVEKINIEVDEQIEINYYINDSNLLVEWEYDTYYIEINGNILKGLNSGEVIVKGKIKDSDVTDSFVVVIQEKKHLCTPLDDDGDCTTAILCKECGKIVVEAEESHEYEDDGDCTTPVVCKNCDVVVTEGKESHKYEDDGDCTTPVVCENCNTIIKEANNEHEISDWMFDQIYKCGKTGTQIKKCINCDYISESRKKIFHHELEIEILEPSCEEEGHRIETCIYCDYVKIVNYNPVGHKVGEYIYLNETKDCVTTRVGICSVCNLRAEETKIAYNGYLAHGKLSVNGRDLVDQDGEKFQLYGLSTHGLQWFGKYANFDTIEAIQRDFGINVIRFALYTDEDGYCSGSDSKKKAMLQDLKEGIDAATKLGLYVIIDWHMVGAENVLDKNPLTYVNESMEFFSMISEEYKDYNNIIYEIMNEPNGSTTWNDCKEYANKVIPCIRKNTDAVILIGNPKWSADLNSVVASPLQGYNNIMYTYHFYAADHKNTSQVINAYDKGIPVFISEYGMMLSSGDGDIDTVSGENWIKVLDDRNISYVAWNISNSGGSASIFKEGSTNMTDTSDDNLKVWGIYLKKFYRRKAGL